MRFSHNDRLEGAATPPALPLPVEILDKAVYTIGRSDSADVLLRGDLASRLHAAVLQDIEGRKFLVDLKSTHGTYVDSKKLTPNMPMRWSPGMQVSFGAGSKAEILVMSDGRPDRILPEAKRRREEEKTEVKGPKASGSQDALAALYADLPEAESKICVPKEVSKFEQLPPPIDDPSKVLFLDVDGVLRPLHSRQDAFQHARTIDIGGSKVALLGNSEASAGIDFWPTAMRALRFIVQKTGARIVLSSDWRKEEVLRKGIASSFEEYRMPPLYSQTPDLDFAAPGVIKALHSSFREKRCKEIRKWLRQHPNVTTWIAIDDIDLSLPDKEGKRHVEMGHDSVFLDPGSEFVRTNPQTGLTMDLARLAVSFLNGIPVSDEEFQAAYGRNDGS